MKVNLCACVLVCLSVRAYEMETYTGIFIAYAILLDLKKKCFQRRWRAVLRRGHVDEEIEDDVPFYGQCIVNFIFLISFEWSFDPSIESISFGESA